MHGCVCLFVCVRASACTTRTQKHQQYANIQHYLLYKAKQKKKQMDEQYQI